MALKEYFKHLSIFSLMRRIKFKLHFLCIALEWIWIRIICCLPSKRIRRMLLCTYKGVSIHRSVPIYSGFEWWAGPLIIGEGSSVGFHNHLDCRKGLTIGKSVCLASYVTIWTMQHDYNTVDFAPEGASVNIGDYAWLCSHCIILPGVSIGEGAVVASGAVVTKDVPPYSVVGGIPARVIGQREKKQYAYRPGDYWIPFV